jgi:hypothetical protein
MPPFSINEKRKWNMSVLSLLRKIVAEIGLKSSADLGFPPIPDIPPAPGIPLPSDPPPFIPSFPQKNYQITN